MTKAEKERLLDDKWPKYTKKEQKNLLKGLKEISKLRLFDPYIPGESNK